MSPTGTRSPQIERQLAQRTADFDAARLSGRATVTDVVRRGRRRLLVTRLLSGVATTAVVAAGAAVLPPLLTDEPAPPAILETPERDEAPAVPDIVDTPEVDTSADENAEAQDAWASGWSIAESTEPEPPPKAPEPTQAEPAPEPKPSEPAPEPKPSEPAPEPKPSEPAPEPKPSEPAPEPKPSEPAPEPKPSEPAPEPKPSEPAPEPKPSEPAVAFTAHQMHEASDAEPPANTYWGTAQPGAEVKIWSDYGWAVTTATDAGEWEAHVTFADAPAGTTTFPVKAKNLHTGEHVLFEFTTHRGEAVAFTADQAHHQVEGDPPTNVYWGTAAPGAEIKVVSEYGYAVTTANENGDWEVQVTFADTPAGTTTFPVKAKNLHTGEYVMFELTTVRPEPDGGMA